MNVDSLNVRQSGERKKARPMSPITEALFAPKVVALIGVSDDPAKLSARPLLFSRQHGFVGRIYIVNPRRKTVLGETAYLSVAAIPDKVDHAYILVGTSLVEAALDDCIAASVEVVTILADGFAEAGTEGLERQQRLVDKADKAGIMLIGPNSMGVTNSLNGFVCTTNAAFKIPRLPAGRLAVLSHSGSLIGTLLSRGDARNIGFSRFISLGNEAQSCVGKVGLTLVDDPEIDCFVLFLETIRNPEIFAAFAAAAWRSGKPVVAYMLGKSAEGQALSVSHTGALMGEADAVSAFLRHHHIAEVSQLDALFEAPSLLLQRARMDGRPRRATIITTTGGGGAMLVDQLRMRGVDLVGLSPQSAAYFADHKIPFGSGNLVDVTLAGAQYDIMKSAITQLINDPETGVLVVAIGSSAQFNPELAVMPIIDAVAENPNAAPVAAFPLPFAPETMEMLRAAGIPCFGGLESAADSIALMLRDVDSDADYPVLDAATHEQIDSMLDRHIAASSGPVLNEVTAGSVFAELGIGQPAQVFITDWDAVHSDAVWEAGLSYPLVAKLVSTDLPHKTDYGAVVLNIETPDHLIGAVEAMREAVATNAPAARIDGVLLQEMLSGIGEALVGLRRDNLVGPVITVGAGGIMAEIYRDVVMRPAPVSIETAKKMISEVKGFAVLRGYRGMAAGDIDALAGVISAVSLLAANPRIAEAEINPVLVLGDGAVMLDALIRLATEEFGGSHGQ